MATIAATANFYPRPPCGGRQKFVVDIVFRQHISIHALRVEGDLDVPEMAITQVISIHALRVEGDVQPHYKPKKA